jgi:hypothetical protein
MSTIANANVMNNIKEILEALGFKIDKRYPLPFADHVLERLEMTSHRLVKVIEGREQLTLKEAQNFAEWLGIDLADVSKEAGEVSVSIEVQLKDKSHAAA